MLLYAAVTDTLSEVELSPAFPPGLLRGVGHVSLWPGIHRKGRARSKLALATPSRSSSGPTVEGREWPLSIDTPPHGGLSLIGASMLVKADGDPGLILSFSVWRGDDL